MFRPAWIRKHGQAFAALALLAMIVRAIVPAGYMLAPARQGELLAITLCSGHGPVEALIDLNTGALVEHQKKAPEKSAASDAPCVFAAVPALAAPEAPFTLAVSFIATRAAPSSLADIAPGRGLAAPPPWATGPPATA
ncbi:MAG: hypothetical protein ABUS57_14730 [Pseudomonadota bacterium]